MRSTVVGVVGGSQAGKTTLVNGLVGSLPDGATVLSFDEYYHDLAHLTPEERAVVNFDHPDSLDDDLLISHLDGLLAGRPADVPVYDFATHTRTGRSRRVDPGRSSSWTGSWCWPSRPSGSASTSRFLSTPQPRCAWPAG